MCVIGLFISFSLITIYAFIGMVGYIIWRRYIGNFVVYFVLITFCHFGLAIYFYDMIDPILLPTFDARYAGLFHFYSSSDWASFLWGFRYFDSSTPINILHPYSNIGSVLVHYGVFGLGFYLIILSYLAKRSGFELAVVALFLFGFNYYYLTAWPIIIIYAVLFVEGSVTISKSRNYTSALGTQGLPDAKIIV